MCVTVTEAFKRAQVLPLLKKPGMDKNELANYRLISNLVTISKVLERLALNRLRPQMLESPLYSELQSAYRKGHSTETALLHMLNGVYAAVDSKAQIPLGSTRLDSTRSTCRAHAFWLCRASRTAQLDSLDTTRSTGSTGSTRRTRLARLARHAT